RRCRRNDERHVLADPRALHRIRARARGHRRQGSSGHSRQASQCTGGEAALRAPRQGAYRSRRHTQMSNVPADLKYTRTHEWVRSLKDGTIEIGISDHAQHSLGDLVFVEVPEPGRQVGAGEPCAVVESVKAASDVYSPVAGEVTAGNAE